MLQFFRNFFSSKIGAALALGLLILIALAFASGDVANTGTFGGVAGGNRVATVGDERIDTSTLSQAATNALDRMKEDNPTASMQAFLAQGGLDEVLDSLIDRLAVAVFGKQNGVVAGDRLVDSEIARMPAFKGPDGKFSEDLFRQMMQQRGISEQMIRDDLSQGLIARQVMLPASVGASMSTSLAKRYAALLRETRTGEITVVPSTLFASKEDPGEKQIAEYYRASRDDFIRPERRVIRYAIFSADELKDLAAPTDAEIAYRFKSDSQKYAASERRRITQTIVPTEAAAKAIVDELATGKSLEAAAKAKGLSANSLELFSKDELGRQFSRPVADAVFAAPARSIAAPARSTLGWHVIRVDEVDKKPARTLEQVRNEIAATISAEKRQIALSETLEKVEDRFDEGANLSDVAASLGLKIAETKPLTADGKVYATRNEAAPKVLEPVLDTAFAMSQEEPQLAEVERGKTFVLYDVTDITESAAAPLEEVRDEVKAAYVRKRASDEAKRVARQIQALVAKGKSLQEAARSVEKRLPPVQRISMTRPELAAMQSRQGQVPPPIALMFNMAAGTVKAQPVPGGLGWFLVSLKEIRPGEIADDDQIIQRAKAELSVATGQEYSDALGRAIRTQVGVKRNQDGIRAVRKQLGGGS